MRSDWKESSDVLSDISFGILFDISDISSDILWDISFDILSGTSSNILSDISFDILSGPFFLTYQLTCFLTYLRRCAQHQQNSKCSATHAQLLEPNSLACTQKVEPTVFAAVHHIK